MTLPPFDIDKLSRLLSDEKHCLWTFVDSDVEQHGVPLVQYFTVSPVRFKWLKTIRLPKGVEIDIKIPSEAELMTRWTKVMMACSHMNTDFPFKRPYLTTLKTDGALSKHKPFRVRLEESATAAVRRCTKILDSWISWRLDTVVVDETPKEAQVRKATRYFEVGILLRYISTLQRPKQPNRGPQKRRLLCNMSANLSIAIQSKVPPCPNKQARSIISGPWNARCFKSKARDLLRMDEKALETFLAQYRRPQVFPARKVRDSLDKLSNDIKQKLKNLCVPLRFPNTSSATLVSWLRCIVSKK